MSGGPDETVVSVAELDRRLKRVIETVSAGLWVEGEVTSLKRASSGHVYFTLKDDREEATVECVMYRTEAARASRFLFDGARVQLLGRATFWAPRGRLQFVGTRMRFAGEGALLLAFLALKQRLEAEGLFDPARKRRLPEDARVIGVVTSRAGAAFHDIRTVAFRRANVQLVLSTALVQGDGAPESLCMAIQRLERYPGLDVMIIGRGGGSGEDLRAFNDERVVRRIAAARVPVVSAVGHEIDVSLADLVADVRAATPSQAAELVVSDANARKRALLAAEVALGRAVTRRLLGARSEVDQLLRKLWDPRFLIAERKQELDELETRLRRRLDRTLFRQGQTLSALLGRLLGRHPRAVVARERARLGPLFERLSSAMRLDLGRRRARLALSAGQLDALSPLAVLSRGYAIALDRQGRALRRANDTRVGEPLRLLLGEGSVETSVERILLPPARPTPEPKS